MAVPREESCLVMVAAYCIGPATEEGEERPETQSTNIRGTNLIINCIWRKDKVVQPEIFLRK